jgi:hypothetical protein
MVITENKKREPLNITREDERLEQVERFEYLGTVVTSRWKNRRGNKLWSVKRKLNIL